MLVAYLTRIRDGKDYTDLCIIPDKPDLLTVPTSLFTLGETPVAVYRIGPEESFITNIEPDGALVITPIEPAGLYLTLNVAVRPGMRVKRVKVIRTGEKSCKIYFEKERAGWEEYLANRQRV